MSESTDFLLYTAPAGAVRVEVLVRAETVWLTQADLATLFAVRVPAISKHLSSIFESGELVEGAVVSILERTAADSARPNMGLTSWKHAPQLNDYAVLPDKGSISALEARLKAEAEYEVFRKRQDVEWESDFDKEIKRIEGKNR